jgi:protein-tyrosine phosphatase
MRFNERLIDLESAYNFRHACGYQTQQGTFAEWGRIYRSGEICNLTEHDIERLNFLEIKTIIDFRTEQEKADCPDANLSTVKNRIDLPIDAGSMVYNIQKYSALTNGREIMREVNRFLVRNCINEYSAFFKICSDKKNIPILFHCSAGKDRTGLAAALLLSAIGVDRETIITDYCLSATYLLGREDLQTDDPIKAAIFTVTDDYIKAAFEIIDTEFNGIKNYLTKTLGVDIDLLRTIYTE